MNSSLLDKIGIDPAIILIILLVLVIVLCLDNDEAGRTRTQDIIKHLEGNGKTVEDRPPTIGKDYNDTLVQVTQEYQKHCISLDDILEETR